MKKLLLIASLCVTTFTYTFTKNDLESAVRSLDVASVRQILSDEKLTRQEYECYLNLAEETVSHREALATKTYPMYDVETPYNGPSIRRIVAEGLLGWEALKMGVFCAKALAFCTFHRERIPSEYKLLFAGGASFGVLFAGKFLYDLKQRFDADNSYKDLLRKKYDDAVTIKQLIYMTNIVEA
jgi:hypothetical protein